MAKDCHHERLWHDNARGESLEERRNAARAHAVAGTKVGRGALGARLNSRWVGELGRHDGLLKSRAARASLARLEHHLQRWNAVHFVLLAGVRVVATPVGVLARVAADFLNEWGARNTVAVECGHHLVAVLVPTDV